MIVLSPKKMVGRIVRNLEMTVLVLDLRRTGTALDQALEIVPDLELQKNVPEVRAGPGPRAIDKRVG